MSVLSHTKAKFMPLFLHLEVASCKQQCRSSSGPIVVLAIGPCDCLQLYDYDGFVLQDLLIFTGTRMFLSSVF